MSGWLRANWGQFAAFTVGAILCTAGSHDGLGRLLVGAFGLNWSSGSFEKVGLCLLGVGAALRLAQAIETRIR